ncbi:MAG: hypothetical protein OXU20_38890 [Myxococcales bacterium]|nr:hypothetical protein [Myxococcales bacterium]
MRRTPLTTPLIQTLTPLALATVLGLGLAPPDRSVAQDVAGSAQAQADAPRVTLQLRTTRRVYRLGEPIHLELLLRNDSYDEACVPREMGINGSLHLELTLHGKPVPYVGRVVRVPLPGVHSFACLAHQEFIGHTFDLSARSRTGFRIEKAGKYQLRARFTNRDVLKMRARLKTQRGTPEPRDDPRCLAAEEGWDSYWHGELTDEVWFRVKR